MGIKMTTAKWHRLGLFPWLRMRNDHCAHCAACPPGTFEMYHTVKKRVVQHEKSRGHLRAVGLLTETEELERTSPSKKQFREVWDVLRKGQPPEQGVDGVGKRMKISHMRACLAEALRSSHRKFILALSSPGCWSLKRDESKHRLCLLFRGVNAEVVTREAMLGWERCDITDSVTKAKQTDDAFKTFATPMDGYMKPGNMDEAVYAKLKDLMEFMCTDAASSEILSVKMMRHGLKLDGVGAVTPNLRCHTRDKAHSTKRILIRPFSADPFMQDIVTRFIMAEKSLVSVVHHSAEFQNIFKAACAKRGIAPVHLGLAKHRFSCYRKVLSAHVDHMFAFFDVAIYIISTRARSTPEYRVALQFLEEPTEVRVQLAMMCDATEEVMELLRYVDDDSPDLALVSAECASFAEKVKYMWLQGGAFKVEGYTTVMLKKLATPVTYQIEGRMVTTCGVSGLDCTHPLVRTCAGRMQCWVTLATLTLQTEFPSFELCQAFTVLALGESRKHDRTDPAFMVHLQRLGRAFDLEPDDLARQLKAFKPAASAAYAAGLSTLESWRQSVFRKTRSTVPGDALRTVLVKFAACTVSTHLIDSSFSIVQRRTAPQQSHRGDMAERDSSQVMLDRCDDEEKTSIIDEAQKLWKAWFGEARSQPRLPRVDIGRTQARSRLSAKASWLANRRHSLAVATYSADLEEHIDCDGVVPEWGPTHTAERAFQGEQQLKHTIDAYKDNTLLPEEIPDTLEAAIVSQQGRVQANLQRNLQRANRRTAAISAASRTVADFDFAGRSVFGQQTLLDKAATWIRDMGLHTVPDRKSATVFVVDNTTAPGNRILWAAGLVGGCIACPWKNSFIVYKNALKTPRHLWISPGFAARSPATTAIVEALVKLRFSRWKFHLTFESFRARTASAARAKRQTIMLGLATSEEIHGLDAACRARVFTESGLLKLIAVTDLKRSLVGPSTG